MGENKPHISIFVKSVFDLQISVGSLIFFFFWALNILILSLKLLGPKWLETSLIFTWINGFLGHTDYLLQGGKEFTCWIQWHVWHALEVSVIWVKSLNASSLFIFALLVFFMVLGKEHLPSSRWLGWFYNKLREMGSLTDLQVVMQDCWVQHVFQSFSCALREEAIRLASRNWALREVCRKVTLFPASLSYSSNWVE